MLKKEIISNQDYNSKIIRDRGLTQECDILEAICELWLSDSEKIYIKAISEKVNSEYSENDEKDKLSNSQVGRIIKNRLKIDTYHCRQGNYINPANKELAYLKTKYGIKECECEVVKDVKAI